MDSEDEGEAYVPKDKYVFKLYQNADDVKLWDNNPMSVGMIKNKEIICIKKHDPTISVLMLEHNAPFLSNNKEELYDVEQSSNTSDYSYYSSDSKRKELKLDRENLPKEIRNSHREERINGRTYYKPTNRR